MDSGSLRSASCFRLVFPVLGLYIWAVYEGMLAPFEAMLAPCEPILGSCWAYVGRPIYEGMLAPFEAMLAPCEPILSSCWAYVGPFLTHFWPILAQIKNFDPFWKTCKTQDSRAKMPPPKQKLISYNAIANGSRRHTKNASAPSVRAD